jgi:hypothetical protein
VWVYAVEFSPDGVIDDHEDLADAVGWTDGSEHLISALRESGWMDGDELHDWDDYGGRLLGRKEANRKRMCSARAAHVQRTCEATNVLTNLNTRGDEKHDDLAKLAAETVLGWKARDDDPAFFETLLKTFTADHIKDVMRRLAIQQSATHKYKDMRRALGNWMKRETPDPRPVDTAQLTRLQRFALTYLREGYENAALTESVDEFAEWRKIVRAGITEGEVLSWRP